MRYVLETLLKVQWHADKPLIQFLQKVVQPKLANHTKKDENLRKIREK